MKTIIGKLLFEEIAYDEIETYIMVSDAISGKQLCHIISYDESANENTPIDEVTVVPADLVSATITKVDDGFSYCPSVYFKADDEPEYKCIVNHKNTW